MSFNINNRRYTGSKYKIRNWIKQIINDKCKNSKSFCDIFAGTGIITEAMINDYEEYIINDFLFSNKVIYDAFFSKEKYNECTLMKYYKKYRDLNADNLLDNYVSNNYGGKFFSVRDSKTIGFIREDIEINKNNLTNKEYSILIASLLYSLDRCANTVGHYDAYIRVKNIRSNFKFELINPIIKSEKDVRKIFIYREDANKLAQMIKSDIIYIDPPYSSRQYSRFYHVLETIVKWDKPELYGVALKPEPENVSEYCKSKAIDYFRELIYDINANYIVVSYNNTYKSKSKSSENKMTLEQIVEVLKSKGKTEVFSTSHQAFNAGKTDLKNHKEYLFVTKVGEQDE